MRRVVGARTVVEAAFLVAVPVVALEVGVGVLGIVGASAVAYLIVLVVEGGLAREGRATDRRERARRPLVAPDRPPTFEASPTEVVRVLRPEAELWPTESQPEPEPELASEPEPEPEPAAAEPEREPEPEPEAEPELERPVLALLPAPEPEPIEAEAEVEPEPEEPVAEVVPIGAVVQPRRWNIWELEQLARSDPDRSEERTFLLLYLREFADPDGLLPVDFDGLVRESFGDLVGVG